jgi:hypothetical protein
MDWMLAFQFLRMTGSVAAMLLHYWQIRNFVQSASMSGEVVPATHLRLPAMPMP